MPVPSLPLVFSDGQTVNASQMNAIVTAINALVSASNTQETAFAGLTKSRALAIGIKSGNINIAGTGVSFGIPGWAASLNVNSIFNAGTGVITIPETGIYRIIAKTLIIANSPTAPRSKVWISSSGVEIALDEDSIGNVGGAFRKSFDPFYYGILNAGQQITMQVQCWGMATGTILGDQNTFILLERMY